MIGGDNQLNHFLHILGKITWYWTRLSTVNHRRSSSNSFFGERVAVHRPHGQIVRMKKTERKWKLEKNTNLTKFYVFWHQFNPIKVKGRVSPLCVWANFHVSPFHSIVIETIESTDRGNANAIEVKLLIGITFAIVSAFVLWTYWVRIDNSCVMTTRA